MRNAREIENKYERDLLYKKSEHWTYVGPNLSWLIQLLQQLKRVSWFHYFNNNFIG